MERNRRIVPFVVATMVVLVCFAQSVSAQTVLVPAGADWKYLDDGSNQAVAWRALGFDDSSWAEGPAELGYGDTDEATVVGFGPDDQAKFSTTYFRHTFNVENASALTGFLVRLVRDDGAIVYLNGIEIFRSNMPEGAVLFDDFAADAVGGDDETDFVSSFFRENYLSNGLNVLAVELHQADGPSSDLGFNLEFLANFEAVPPTIVITAPADGTSLVEGNIEITVDVQFEGGSVTSIEFLEGATQIGESFAFPFTFTWNGVTVGDHTLMAHARTSLDLDGTSAPVTVSVIPAPASTFVRLGDTWRYVDDGSDQGTAWRDAAFDDSGWAEGPARMGYGYGGEATVVDFGPDADDKFVTTYFRKSFTVDDLSLYARLTGELTYDDGAIVYLNGTEVFRINMPPGAAEFDTLALGATDYPPEPLTFNLSQLLAGANVVAVEIHQGEATSSDIGFDFLLQGE